MKLITRSSSLFTKKYSFRLRQVIGNSWDASRGVATKQKSATDTEHVEQHEKLYSSDRETHFGFETVSEETKAQKVRAVFETVADRYDLMNDVMSVGIHRVWKDILVNRIRPGKTTKLIDVAGGTGDIAFRFMKYITANPSQSDGTLFSQFMPQQLQFSTSTGKVKSEASRNPKMNNEGLDGNRNPNNPKADECSEELRSVLICDINPKMLEVGQKRAETQLSPSQLKRVGWLEGDAENLASIPDNSFDVYTIAFGIRNCVHVDKVLQEAFRVLKPGGRFLCLEFSHVNNSLLKWFYDQYSFQIIPVMGQVIAGDWDSYIYLVQSIRKFPTQEDFKSMIRNAGFRFVKYEDLTFGISSIHSGFKLSDQ